MDGNHSTVYTSADILANSSVQLTRGGLILIGLLSGGDYHPAGLPRCGPGIAHGLAKCGLGDELLEAAQSLTRAELPEFLTAWREALRSELRTNSRGHLGSKKPSLAKAIPDSFPDVDVLLSYTNPITSATDAGARRTHTPPRWEREPDLPKIAHLCELHFEWGLKDIIIKRFRTVLWPSIVLRALRRSALEADVDVITQLPSTPIRGRESHQDVLGTPSKLLARHFSSMALGVGDEEEEENCGLRDLIIKIHNSRTHAFTDDILEYRLEIAPAQLVRLASAGIQGLRKPADTTYDVLPSESDDSDEIDDEGGGCGGTSRRKKRRGGGPPPEPESHLRVWMPACMVRFVLPDLVERYEAALKAKHLKKLKSKSKVPRSTARTGATKGVGKPALPSRKVVEAQPVVPAADAEYFDLDVSSLEESDGRGSPVPSGSHLRPCSVTSSQDAPMPTAHSKKPNATVLRGVDDPSTKHETLPADDVRQHSTCSPERPGRIWDIVSEDDDNGDALAPPKRLIHHLSSPSKVLQRLDLNLGADMINNLPGSKVRPPIITPLTLSSSSLPRPAAALRPFPIAFEEEEEEESSESGCDPSGSSPPTCSNNNGLHYHHLHLRPTTLPVASSPSAARRRQWPPPLTAAAREEEEEEEEGGGESSDDPDVVPAELPVLPVQHFLLPQRRRGHGTSAAGAGAGDSHSNMPRPAMHDTFSPSLGLGPGRKQQHSSTQPSPSLPSPPSPSTTQRSSQDLLPPLDQRDHQWRQRRRVSEMSVISISSDASDSGDGIDGDGDGYGDAIAPLLIARSRAAVLPEQFTSTTAGYRSNIVEHEVIDLT